MKHPLETLALRRRDLTAGLLSCLLLPAPSLGLTLAQKLVEDIPYDGSQPALYCAVLSVVLSAGRH